MSKKHKKCEACNNVIEIYPSNSAFGFTQDEEDYQRTDSDGNVYALRFRGSCCLCGRWAIVELDKPIFSKDTDYYAPIAKVYVK